jgi:Glutamine phosphoribosylpyrophosphate amidotransferase
VVIPIPDSSTTAALQLAADLKKPYRQGFVKNRYIGENIHNASSRGEKEICQKKVEYS